MNFYDQAMLRFDISATAYPNLEQRAHTYTYMCNLNAFVIFGTYLKLIKFMNLSERVEILSKTFRSAAVDVSCFLVMFGCIFTAFAVMGMAMFGSNVR